MEIDIPRKKLEKAIDAVRKLETMDFPETNPNILSNLTDIINNLEAVTEEISDQIDY